MSPIAARLRLTAGALPRIASHVVVWTVVMVPTAHLALQGWRPLADEAAISMQAFRVFSMQPPLVGQFSQASAGAHHAVYDPGPLLFWLLAIPVRLAPNTGALWGAGICCAAALSVAVEAVRRVAGAVGGFGFALVVLLLSWALAPQFSNLVWNPNFGLVFFLASIAVAWAVGAGAGRWLPVLVLTASIAAQSHLLYTLSSAALVLVAVVLALVQKRLRLGSVLLAAAVAVACWIAPVWQQLTTQPGNLALLFRSQHHAHVLGLSYGLRVIGSLAAMPPLWTMHPPTQAFPFALLGGRSVVPGICTLALLVVLVLVSWLVLRHRVLVSLSVVTITSVLGTLVVLARFPTAGFLDLSYLDPILWVLALLVWCNTLAVVGVGLWRVGQRVGPATDWVLSRGVRAVALPLTLIAVPLVMAVTFTSSTLGASSRQEIREAGGITDAVLPRANGHSVRLVYRRSAPNQTLAFFRGLALGVAWQLDAHGVAVALPGTDASGTGITVVHNGAQVTLAVTLGRRGMVVTPVRAERQSVGTE